MQVTDAWDVTLFSLMSDAAGSSEASAQFYWNKRRQSQQHGMVKSLNGDIITFFMTD
jgi:hypothetical protein